MNASIDELEAIRGLLARLHGAPPGDLQLQVQPLRGGLEAAGVVRVSARFRDPEGRPRVCTLVVKRLTGMAAREGTIYERLVAAHAAGLSPRLLAAERTETGHVTLFLEAVRPVTSWPWRDPGAARQVLESLARFHLAALEPAAALALSGWDYEEELHRSAERTLELLARCRREDLSCLRRGLSWTRRVVLALAAIRWQLLRFSPLGSGPIHGDVHPGNVLLRRRGGRSEPTLLDWGRARIGSPLEDVSNWLQSLAGWEPEARRRHDTLFVGYLSARRLEPRLSADLRRAYWLAGASNALAGALLHHLTLALDERVTGSRRAIAIYSAREWLRVLRRAQACWG